MQDFQCGKSVYAGCGVCEGVVSVESIHEQEQIL